MNPVTIHDPWDGMTERRVLNRDYPAVVAKHDVWYRITTGPVVIYAVDEESARVYAYAHNSLNGHPCGPESLRKGNTP